MSDIWYTLAFKYSRDEMIYDLHGLWPEACCVEVNEVQGLFKIEELDVKLYVRLERVWNSDNHPPLRHENDEEVELKADIKFWEHEWNRHGRYSGLSMNVYFEKALSLYDKYKSMLPKCNENHQCHVYLDKDYEMIDSDMVKKGL